MTNLRKSGVFSLGALGGDGALTGPWTPADITSTTSPGVTVVGWFDGEDISNNGSANTGSETTWVNKISGQNDLDLINGSTAPTISATNVRTVNASYLSETGTTLLSGQDEVGIYIAARVNSKGSNPWGAVISTQNTGSSSTDWGSFFFYKGSETWASFPNYSTWGYVDNRSVSYRTLEGSDAVFDIKTNISTGWTMTFDGGRDSYSSADANPAINANSRLLFGRQTSVANRTTDTNFYQIVVVHGTLSSTDEEKLHGYLAHKAGSASHLQSTTYQSAAPTKITAALTRPTRRWGGITGRSLVSGSNVPATGVLSLAEHYQSKL